MSKALLNKKELLEKKDNLMIVSFGYGAKFVLPYKDGVTIINAMLNAEKYDTSDYHNHKIVDLENDDIEFKPLAQQKYLNTKMAAILGTTLKEFESGEANETE